MVGPKSVTNRPVPNNRPLLRKLATAMLSAALSVSVGAAGFSAAAELALRQNVICSGSVVTLGEVAEIRGSDALANAALSAIPLFPAPPIGEERFASLQDIQDILRLRGIDLRPHRWAGSASVRMVSAPHRDDKAAVAINEDARRRATDIVVRALRDYLHRNQNEETEWEIQVSLDDRQAAWLGTPDALVAVESDLALGVDQRRFWISVLAAGKSIELPIDAKIRVRQAVVVAMRPLARDTILTPADVKLSFDVADDGDGSSLHSLEDAIGRQLTLSLSAGRVLDKSMLREPILVRRNDVVTVYTRSPGVVVRTNARAKEDGTRGEWIPVEHLEVRGKAILARVVGFREVEILARSPHTQEHR